MARLPRLCLPAIPQHIIQRGTNRQACFAKPDDFAAYASWLAQAAKDNDVLIHAWVFMTNHVHLLVTPKSDSCVSKMIQNLGRHYVRSNGWERVKAYQSLFSSQLDRNIVKNIRSSVQKNLL
ncbi:transposase [Methylophaga pinxianii]|uniref:transposase n=1 Tax=Methylophaga pinxianii TaxID=2881052 RepID=UPI001CF1CD21|nr:transposase [Methylophaga pinxianii]MCB2427689.1 transposase [Methylophaga pinxianii]UPH46192.1 transposase [Methylophaga pinxianii]